MVFDHTPWLEAQEIHLGSIEGGTSQVSLNFTEIVGNINNLFVEGLPIFNYWFKT
jgi:hypothetical protein